VNLRDPAQDLVALRGVALLAGLALEQRRHAVPVLGLEQHPPLRFARACVLGLELFDALPRAERTIDVAQVLLGDDGDLFEARHEVLCDGARDTRAVERELEEIGERDPVALLAEVLGVGGERHGVLRLELQHGVEIDGGLVAVSEAIAVERGELEHDARSGDGLLDDAELPLAQLGELRVFVAAGVQLRQLLRGGSPRRLERRDLAVHALGLG
jgi:hypothetical protein